MTPVPISIVIVNWNTRDLLCACLASIERSRATLGASLEVVVVDNASSDGSAEAAAAFPSVTVILNDANRGFAAATNQGIRATSGRYVMLLNADAELTGSALATLIGFADAHPDVGAVGPRLVYADGRLQVSCSPRPTLGRECWRLLHLDRLRPLAVYDMERWPLDAPRHVDVLGGACLLVRREALDRLGLLDERFFIYSEEFDLCERLSVAGFALVWVPHAVVVHHEGQSTRQVATRMFLQLYRSKVEYFRKHAGRAGAWTYKSVLAAMSVLRVLLAPALALVLTARRRDLVTIARNHAALLAALRAM